MTLLAKSDGTTLEAHTDHVVAAISSIARKLVKGITSEQYLIAIHGAVIHDLGKAHPVFQESLKPDFNRTKYQFDVPHRHELSSLMFLPLFPKVEWPQLVDMVVAHHKSLNILGGVKRGRGLKDLVDDYGEEAVFERHFENWEEWHTEVFALLRSKDVQPRRLSRAEARDAFDEVLRLCDERRFGRNCWRGLLMSADHLASALQEETDSHLDRLFRAPDLAPFDDRARQASAEFYPLAKKSANSSKPHTLIVAPTGAGKTDFLLRRCRQGRVFYLLPFQASINAMYLRMDRTLNGIGDDRLPLNEQTDIRRLHASAQIELDEDIEEEYILQRHPGAALKVMTPHQIASIVFGLSGHEAMALDLAGQNVILDEVHVYSDQCQAMVLEITRSLVRLGCSVHIGSATIPTALHDKLLACLGSGDLVDEVRLTDAELQSYDRHFVHRISDEQEARSYIRDHVADGKRILLISNRVADAQERFRWVQRTFPDVPAMLVHSRYRRMDRARIEKDIDVFDRGNGPCIVCSTQVIEVSLDISFDTLVTDCAPLDSMIQRFGRVNRRRKYIAEHTLCPVAIIAPPDVAQMAKPYDINVLKRSWEALVDGAVIHEVGMQALIDSVYPTVDLTEIDIHLIDSDDGVKLPELCNRPRSLLLDALEIDSACVIRGCDMVAYKHSGSERQMLEIPVPIASLRPKMKSWRQIDVGNKPFVCFDHCYDELLGLLLGSEGEPACIIL